MEKFWFIFIFGVIILMQIATVILPICIRKDLLSKYKDIKTENRKLKNEVKSLTTGSLGIGHSLKLLEKVLEELKNNQEQSSMRNSAISSYAHATKMVEMGANEEDIINSCGLSKAEAQLIALMYSKKTEQQEVTCK